MVFRWNWFNHCEGTANKSKHLGTNTLVTFPNLKHSDYCNKYLLKVYKKIYKSYIKL